MRLSVGQILAALLAVAAAPCAAAPVSAPLLNSNYVIRLLMSLLDRGTILGGFIGFFRNCETHGLLSLR